MNELISTSLVQQKQGITLVDATVAVVMYERERTPILSEEVRQKAFAYVVGINEKFSLGDLVTFRISMGTFGTLSPSTPFAAWLVQIVREEIFEKMDPEEKEKLDKEIKIRMLALKSSADTVSIS